MAVAGLGFSSCYRSYIVIKFIIVVIEATGFITKVKSNEQRWVRLEIQVD